jgi:hypothetical protein
VCEGGFEDGPEHVDVFAAGAARVGVFVVDAEFGHVSEVWDEEVYRVVWAWVQT